MDRCCFDFSVVMSVYNVEKYIREAVESLVHQSIGFSRIQLIMVDDGSTDGSGRICDEYKKKYPENVLVIHKKNGGLSSSRNTGLPLTEGKYVSFFDPDDTLPPDTFQKVFSFMEAHPEVDISCIPIFHFGNQSGPHNLNYKFSQGTRVIDLLQDENADQILLSAASSFYRRSAAAKMSFDTELYTAEDAKENLRLLMDNPRLGLVADAGYNYRKHGNSILDKAKYTSAWYLTQLQNFSKWALDEAEQKYGYIPRFVQYTVIYDLEAKLNQTRVPEGVLSEQETDEYKKLLIRTACRFDDEIILQQKKTWIDVKLFILEKKYKDTARLVPCVTENHTQDLELYYGDRAVARISKMKTVVEFIRIDQKKRLCYLEGYHIVCGIGNREAEPWLLVNEKGVLCTVVNRERKIAWFHGEQINRVIGFTGTVPLEADSLNVCACLKIGDRIIKRQNISPGQFFPVCTIYRNSYCLKKNYVIRMDKKHISIKKKPSLPVLFMKECAFLAEIWKKNRLGGRKAVGGRIYYHLLKPFKKKQLWIVSDRIMKADDNGEALFRYLRSNPPENTRVVYAISRNSPDYKKMKKVGPCVDSMSFHHKLLHLLCDVNISAQADGVTVNPFNGYCDALRDLLDHQHFVFLQHGIIKDDLSGWLNKYNKDMSGFVTSAEKEWESIVKGRYYYTENTIWLTGLPRYDRLYHKEKRVITLMPTWRRYLMGTVDSKSGKWIMEDSFKESDYFVFYNKLINSPRLLSYLEKRRYRLQFFPHPNLQPVLEWFQHDPRVVFLHADTPYRDVYAESRLVITDYSSAVFDFAYLRKPVIYCQFDKDTFFAGNHVYEKGYFDYEKDGFGEVTYDLETLIDKIIQYVENEFKLKDVYRERIDSFFSFNDQNNCHRVTEKILTLPEKC